MNTAIHAATTAAQHSDDMRTGGIIVAIILAIVLIRGWLKK